MPGLPDFSGAKYQKMPGLPYFSGTKYQNGKIIVEYQLIEHTNRWLITKIFLEL
jgi:hypothetical protein